MLFNSWTFWAFYALVLPTYRILPFRAQNLFLLGASYVFYGWWDWRFLPLIAFSTVMDYWLGNRVAAAAPGLPRRRYVRISVVVNLLLLGVFKYYDFFAHEIAAGMESLGFRVSIPFLELILPVGISFYTFQSMSYVLDIARGVTRPANDFWTFALYVAFFPHLVAGPIMRSGAKGHEELGPGLLKQLEVPRKRRVGDFSQGLYYVVTGLFRKIVIGDNMASLVNTIFQKDASQLTGLECLAGVYAFTWQIYADFSGYSSIAQGVAKWMGIDLMDNFKSPYLAISPSDFWKRWHISLSTWLRDYLYVPLGGNRHGPWSTYRNLMLTMILGGLWHGANWTFVCWGVFHGALLCLYRVAGWETKTPRAVVVRIAKTSVLFHLVAFGWLMFRAESMEQVATFVRLIATDWRFTSMAGTMLLLIAFYTLPLLGLELWIEGRRNRSPLPLLQAWPARAAVYSYMVLMLVFFPSPTAHEFIYFQF